MYYHISYIIISCVIVFLDVHIRIYIIFMQMSVCVCMFNHVRVFVYGWATINDPRNLASKFSDDRLMVTLVLGHIAISIVELH